MFMAISSSALTIIACDTTIRLEKAMFLQPDEWVRLNRMSNN